MRASTLYGRLNDKFISEDYEEVGWSDDMDHLQQFISPRFQECNMGVVFDFSTEIKTVYTAVFPSQYVMKTVLDEGARDALLFTHHPATWDITDSPDVWTQIQPGLVQKFEENDISLYTLHVPLDDWHAFATGYTFAEAIDVQPDSPFAEYNGAQAGVIGECNLQFNALADVVQDAVGHEIGTYRYGPDRVERVGVIGGGGTKVPFLKEAAEHGVDALLTGITAKNEHSRQAHATAREASISLIGTTHYSSEMFACQKMCHYFRQQGLEASFTPGTPVMQDL